MPRYPSPAMTVALLALVLSLGGTAYAVTQIDGKLLKSRSVSHTKLKKHTLTGAEINKAQLGSVPSAAQAIHAGSADTATTLDGLAAGSFVQGGGRVLFGTKIITSASKTPIVAVPGVGELTGSYSGGSVAFYLTNGTGQTVDRTFAYAHSGTTDGNSIDPEQDLLNTPGSGADLLTVQLAWGSGASARFVRLSISWFLPGTDAHVLVQGIAS